MADAAHNATPSHDEIDALLRHFEQVYNGGDPEEAAQIYAKDAVFQSIMGVTAEGREAVHDFYANLPPDALPEGSRIRLTATRAEYIGDLLYLTGMWAWRGPDGEPVMQGEYVNLLKHEDGQWKEYRLTTFAPRGMPEKRDDGGLMSKEV